MAIAYLTGTIEGSPGGVGVVTDAIDTTGADLIVASVSRYGAAGTFLDSKGNTWTALTKYSAAGGGTYETRLFYCLAPTTGPGHTFEISGTISYPLVAVLAFSGVASFGTSSGGDDDATPGPLTPAADGSLVVTGAVTDAAVPVVDGSFIPNLAGNSGGNYVGGGIAYLIQTTAAAANPTWSGSALYATSIADFAPSPGGGGPGPGDPLIPPMTSPNGGILLMYRP